MIIIDANLLIYSFVEEMQEHQKAKSWLETQLSGRAVVGLPWPSLLAFVRLTTNPRVFREPVSITRAWEQVESWLDCTVVRIPLPAERHRDILGTCLVAGGVRGNLVQDAHLAALAIENGMLLYSTDGDFARFPGLRWENPLRK